MKTGRELVENKLLTKWIIRVDVQFKGDKKVPGELWFWSAITSSFYF